MGLGQGRGARRRLGVAAQEESPTAAAQEGEVGEASAGGLWAVHSKKQSCREHPRVAEAEEAAEEAAADRVRTRFAPVGDEHRTTMEE